LEGSNVRYGLEDAQQVRRIKWQDERSWLA